MQAGLTTRYPPQDRISQIYLSSHIALITLYFRKEVGMADAAKGRNPRGEGMLPPMVTLALWRLRRMWRLLIITGLGMVAAVMLVCAVPLYSQVSLTAGLRGILNASPENADIMVYSIAEQVNSSYINKVTNTLNQEFQSDLGSYLSTPQFFMQTPSAPLAKPAGHNTFTLDHQNLAQIYDGSMPQIAPHITLLQGRLPSATAKDIEVALLPQTASLLKATIGSVFYYPVALLNAPPAKSIAYLPLHVVGIFSVKNANDPFWHQVGFDPVGMPPPQSSTLHTMLASSANVLSVYSQLFSTPQSNLWVLKNAVEYYWYYRLDVDHLTINDLYNVLDGVYQAQMNVSSNVILQEPPYTDQTKIILPTDILQQFSDRIPIARIPVNSLLFLILGLVLFFVSMMADLLVDRQSETIAILRSRGASRPQIFGSLVIQSLGLGVVALALGPLLALVLVRLVALRTFTASDQTALETILSNPLQTLWDLRWYALAAVGVGVLAMIVSLFRAVSRDVLSLRRESARTSTRPLWQRLNLDIVAAIIMLVGYGTSLYVSSAGVLDPQLQLLLLTPLTLVGAVFLLLACLLLFLRLFPLLLEWGSWLATRNKGAAPVLALAQMARAPRQSLRMTLLLALATAFAIFTLVFTASQQQRIVDVSSYQGGADFSGPIANQSYPLSQLQPLTTRYRAIAGVLSATVGNSSTATAANGSLLSFTTQIMAVDADNFARTAIWTQQDSTQSLSSLMQQLVRQRDTAINQNIVLAIVDAAAWKQLNLSPGASFTLTFSDGPVNFVALAEVQHIPTITDNTGSGSNANGANSGVSSGGILVDYQTYAAVYQSLFHSTSGATVPINYIWLRTKSDAQSLASVRRALSTGPLQLSTVYDRRATSQTLRSDPLYLDLIIVLALGAATALLLALLGNLIASWLSARSRLTSFAVLRALGTPPWQIASVLTWEQGIIYTTAILLGVIFGFLLSALAVPVLVFTSVGTSGANSDISSGAFYIAQSVPPIQVIVPVSVALALAVLIAICVIALGMMIRVVSRPSIGQTLRLNED